MPEANSEPSLSNPLSRYPRIAPAPAQRPKLLDRLREALRSRHYSRRTEENCGHWAKEATYHRFQRSFAAHPVEGDYDIRTVSLHSGYNLYLYA